MPCVCTIDYSKLVEGWTSSHRPLEKLILLSASSKSFFTSVVKLVCSCAIELHVPFKSVGR